LLAARAHERIGWGGLGVVHRAWDPVLERTVAVKLLNQLADADLSPMRRLALEAQATASLVSPHIVQVFDFGYQGEQPYLVMEYLPEGTLADQIACQGRPSAQRIADIGRQIAAGLAVAHARGLIHRDVTPPMCWRPEWAAQGRRLRHCQGSA
jgi:serine/threonine-protein kinase